MPALFIYPLSGRVEYIKTHNDRKGRNYVRGQMHFTDLGPLREIYLYVERSCWVCGCAILVLRAACGSIRIVLWIMP